jgi:hypothetical protein
MTGLELDASIPGREKSAAPTDLRMNPRIYQEHRESGDLQTVFAALSLVPGVRVTRAFDLPPQTIAVGNRPIGFVDDLDGWDSLEEGGGARPALAGLNPAIIFKLQYRAGARYPPGTIAAGFFAHPAVYAMRRAAGSGHVRKIAVTSRMRTAGYAGGQSEPWMAERQRLVAEAMKLRRAGYCTVFEKIELDGYLAELTESEVGFNWRGFGRLTYRLIEYIAAGVVPITQPLGPEWPLRADITLEDGITAIFCDRPEHFGAEAKALLRDRRKVARMREALRELWTGCLALPAMGQWYWEQLRRAYLRTR